MKKFFLVFLLSTLLTMNTAVAQNNGKSVAPVTSPTKSILNLEPVWPQPELPIPKVTEAPRPIQVQAPSQQLRRYDRVMYILDASGSMIGRLADAIRVIDVFASDSFKAAAVTFNDNYVRWKGVKDPCTHPEKDSHSVKCSEPGWAWMPSHRKALFRYLRRIWEGGGTHPTAALIHAYKTAPKDTILVLVTDGILSKNDKHYVSVIAQCKAWRKKKKLAPIQMLVWAPSKSDSQRPTLIKLAKAGGGGLWRAADSDDR